MSMTMKIHELVRYVDTLAIDHDIDPGDSWRATIAPWNARNDAIARNETRHQALVAALRTGDAEKIDITLIAAVALAGYRTEQAGIPDAVVLTLRPELHAAVADVGRSAHRQLADRFNDAAHQLAEAVALVSPDATLESVLMKPAKVREAFMDLATLARTVADAAEGLLVAYGASGGTVLPKDAVLSLTLDVPAIAADRLRRAETLARAGDWETLAREGYPLLARDLDGLDVKPLPPLEWHMVGRRPGSWEYEPLTGKYTDPVIQAEAAAQADARQAQKAREDQKHRVYAQMAKRAMNKK